MNLKDDIQKIIDMEDKWLKENETSNDSEEYEYHLGRYDVAKELMEILKHD